MCQNGGEQSPIDLPKVDLEYRDVGEIRCILHSRETDDLKWSGSDHDLDHYLARKDRIVAHIFENGKG